MNTLFLEDTQFGSLRYKNIYEFFEEPKFFSVINEVGCLYIIYWIGDEEDFDKWYIIPISQERLEFLERMRIDIYSALVYQEQKVFYQINIPYDDEYKPELIKYNASDILTKIKLPKAGLYISGVTPVLDTGKLGSLVQFSTHEVHIEKITKSSSPLAVSGVSKIFEKFNDFYNSILMSVDQKDVMTPVSGRPGSFVLSFQAEKLELFEPLLKKLNDLVLYKKDITNYIEQNNIDVQVLYALFQSVIETSSSMELKSNSTDEIIFNLRKSDAEIYIKSLAKMASQYVGGYQVPQADIPSKIFSVVELKLTDKHLDIASTGLDERHVLYYIHAAKVLGFLNENGSVSALGQQLVNTSDDDSKLRIAARSFESSHCGWAWVMWSDAKDITGIDPKTAEQFLFDKCLSLSRETMIRRARCLRRWCEILRPHYRSL